MPTEIDMMPTSITSSSGTKWGYLKTYPGILQIFQMILGCVTCGLIGHYITADTKPNEVLQIQMMFLHISAAFLITTSFLFFSCLCSFKTAAIIPKTLLEPMYHVIAAATYFSVGVYFMVFLTGNKRYLKDYDPKLAASVIALVNTALYVFSSIISVRGYRRG